MSSPPSNGSDRREKRRKYVQIYFLLFPQTNEFRIDFRKDVTVLVGKSEQKFVAHTAVLIGSSDFFTSALSDAWRKSQGSSTAVVRIPEHAAKTFSIYLHFRYTVMIDLWDGEKETESTAKLDNDNDKTSPKSTKGRFTTLIDCYVLGDMLGDRTFRNALVDAWFGIVKELRLIPSSDDTNKIFRSLPELSKLRQLITEALYTLTDDSYRANEYEPDLFKAMADAAVKDRFILLGDKTPAGRGRCYYHDHVEGEGKCA